MRTREEITCQILQSALEGATQTRLMYQAYLSHNHLKNHVSSLVSSGLLEYVSGEMKYKTTPAGRRYVEEKMPSCNHQCKKCGMMYSCGNEKCHNSFHYGSCTMCQSYIGSHTATA